MLLLPILPVPRSEVFLHSPLTIIHEAWLPVDRKPEQTGGFPHSLQVPLQILELHVGESFELLSLIVMGQPHPLLYNFIENLMGPPPVSESLHGFY